MRKYRQKTYDFREEMNMIRSQKVNVDRYGMVSLVDNIFISKSRKLLTKTLTYSDFQLSKYSQSMLTISSSDISYLK